jgi:hypothetical protein
MKKLLSRSKVSIFIAMGAALCLLPTLFFGCASPLNAPQENAPAPAGYGSVTVNFAGGAARTVLPARVFDNYSYSFTKSGGSARKMLPRPDGKFTLETGQWTVEVKAYTGAADEENLAATGTAQFIVNYNEETSITVYLTGRTESGSGTFKYRIQYPAAAAITSITMEKLKLSASDADLTLDLSTLPVLETGAMVMTKTVDSVSAGFYLLRVRLAIGGTVAGRDEVVHIYNSLSSEFGTEVEPVVFNMTEFAHPGAPSAPATPTAAAADSQLTVSWAAVAYATAYEVWYGTANNSAAAGQFGGDVTTGTSVVITGLTNGTTYYVWVKAKNGVGPSAFSSSRSGSPTSSATAPPAPGTPAITVGDRQLTVSWTPVARATAYEVWYGTVNNTASATQFGADITSGASAVITGLDNGTTYYVWVRAKNNSGLTSNFNTTAASGVPTAGPVVPAAPTATQIGDQLQLAVSWTPVGGATSYRVVYNTANNTTGAKEIDTISGTTGTITGAREASGTLENRLYYVFVKAINDLGESAYGPAGIGIFPPPAAPTVTPYSATGLYAAWAVVPGASAYEVYYNTADTTEGASQWSTNPAAAGVALTGLSAGETYYVWVKARFNTGPVISNFSPAGSGTVPITPAAPAAAPAVTPGVRQLALSWTAVTGATAYEVWYGTSNDSNDAVKFGDTPLATAVITNLADTVSYYVWIKAKNVAGTSGFGPVASAATRAPSVISIRGTVTVKDSGGSAVTSFTLFKSSGGGTPQTIVLSVEGTFTNGQWYVDGAGKGGGSSLSLDADDYTATVHSVSFTGWRDGVYMSSTPILFIVYGF